MPHPAPISSAFAPTPQTLWAAWGRAGRSMAEAGWAEPISQEWILASPGERGLTEIRSFYRDEFLAAVPMEQIQAASTLLQEAIASSHWPSWLPRAARKRFYLVQDANGVQRWVVSAKPPKGEQVLLDGRLDDFNTLVKTGNETIAKTLYANVFQDVRPDEPGHPWDWLQMMQSPHTWGPAREMFWKEPHE